MPCERYTDERRMLRSEILEALGYPMEAERWRRREALPEQRQRELGVYQEPGPGLSIIVCRRFGRRRT